MEEHEKKEHTIKLSPVATFSILLIMAATLLLNMLPIEKLGINDFSFVSLEATSGQASAAASCQQINTGDKTVSGHVSHFLGLGPATAAAEGIRDQNARDYCADFAAHMFGVCFGGDANSACVPGAGTAYSSQSGTTCFHDGGDTPGTATYDCTSSEVVSCNARCHLVPRPRTSRPAKIPPPPRRNPPPPRNTTPKVAPKPGTTPPAGFAPHPGESTPTPPPTPPHPPAGLGPAF